MKQLELWIGQKNITSCRAQIKETLFFFGSFSWGKRKLRNQKREKPVDEREKK